MEDFRHSASASVAIPRAEEGQVWYFAYGSNMAPKVLTGRRKVKPLVSIPCEVAGHVLTFNYRAIPYSEPCFATIMPTACSDDGNASTANSSATLHSNGDSSSSSTGGEVQQQVRPSYSCGGAAARAGVDKQLAAAAAAHSSSSRGISAGVQQARAAHASRLAAGLHGVVHLLHEQDWREVQRTEGVGRQHNFGYQVVQLRCDLYDGRSHVMAYTLEAAPFSLGSADLFLPSARYLDILREGARHHGVAPAYCQMLDEHPAYAKEGRGKTAGRYMSLGMMLMLATPLFPVAAMFTAVEGVKSLILGRPMAPSGTAVVAAAADKGRSGNKSSSSSSAANGGGNAEEDEGAASRSPSPSQAAPADATAASAGGAKPPLPAWAMRVRERLDSYWVNLYTAGMFYVLWLAHDWLIQPLTGSSGCHNGSRWHNSISTATTTAATTATTSSSSSKDNNKAAKTE